MQWFADSGLAGAPSKYDGSGTLAPFPSDVKGTFFSGGFSDHTVLQREPAKAAVYGVVIGTQPLTNVTVHVDAVSLDDGSSENLYTVDADVHIGTAGYATWKALLRPESAGGNFSITATCGSCDAPDNASTIVDVTFGDGKSPCVLPISWLEVKSLMLFVAAVWFCSGQSNSRLLRLCFPHAFALIRRIPALVWLPMHMDSSRNVSYDRFLLGKYRNIRMHTPDHNNQVRRPREG